MDEKVIKFPSALREEERRFEGFGNKIYDLVEFEDYNDERDFHESMREYGKFLESVRHKNDGDNVEDESVLEKLFTAINLSSYNIEARVMEINMRNIAEYEREDALLELYREARRFDVGGHLLENGEEVNIFYLKMCEHLAQYNMDNELYGRLDDIYEDYLDIMTFEDDIFLTALYQRLVSYIFLNRSEEVEEIFSLANEVNNNSEMILLSKIVYHWLNRRENDALFFANELLEKNKFADVYFRKLNNPEMEVGMPKTPREVRSMLRVASAVNYFGKMFTGHSFLRFFLNAGFRKVRNFGEDDIARLRQSEFAKGIHDEDLKFLLSIGVFSFATVNELGKDFLLEEGVDPDTIRRIEINGLHFYDEFEDFYDDDDEDFYDDDEDFYEDFDDEDVKKMIHFPASGGDKRRQEWLDFEAELADNNLTFESLSGDLVAIVGDSVIEDEDIRKEWQQFREKFGHEYESEADAFEMFQYAYNQGLYDEGTPFFPEVTPLLERTEQIIDEEITSFEKILRLENLVKKRCNLVEEVAAINVKYKNDKEWNFAEDENVREIKAILESQKDDENKNEEITLPFDVAEIEFSNTFDQLLVVQTLGFLYYKEGFYQKAKDTFEQVLAANEADILGVRWLYAQLCLLLEENREYLDFIQKFDYRKDEGLLLSLIIHYINTTNMRKAAQEMHVLKRLNSKFGDLLEGGDFEDENYDEYHGYEQMLRAFKNLENYTLKKYYYDYLSLLYSYKITGKLNPVFEGLSDKIISLLIENNLDTKEELEKYSEKEVLSLPGIGKKTIETLKKSGVEFKK